MFTQSARLYEVLSKAKVHLNFSHKNIFDFGCGPGTAQKIFEHIFYEGFFTGQWHNIDHSEEALKIAKVWNSSSLYKTEFIKSDKIPKAKTNEDLLIAVYSLCELNMKKTEIISRLKEYKSMIILEPGQKKESKKLIELRNELVLDHNFQAKAPCTHQKLCPMTLEKKHWCHDHIDKPEFLNNLSLPFSTNKLNLSYLILSKEKEEKCQTFGRVVGDVRIEKGKTKVAVCHDGQFNYLSWLKKTKLNINLSRGELINWVGNFEQKGNEHRVSTPIQKVEEDPYGGHS